ncbi:M56 family metallopeptidase [Marinigracilibium pacificum]|uniref:M48 family metalloprotease n=1 Tax=Marinigracilibium pacificum TaxID=2729599 RepID=A0A848IYJ9_9BACT|nr:M48 family metalloprotease [Marinigracilibium pacificum]
MYWLSFGALIGGFTWSVQTFWVHWNKLESARAFTFTMLNEQVEQILTVQDSGIVGLLDKISLLIKPYIPELVFVWMIGTILLGLKLLGSYAYLRMLRSKATEIVDSHWNELLEKLKVSLNIDKDIKILKSAAVYGPMVMGHFKPVILIPVGLVTGLPVNQIEAILAHELAHIKRSDYLINFIQSTIEILFFYHPMVWYLSDVLRHEREICCDTVALNYQPSSIQYAKLLTKLEEYALNSHSPAMQLGGQSKHSLLLRIQRIVQPKMQKKTMKDKVLPLIILIVAVVAMSFMDVGKKKFFQSSQNEVPTNSENQKVKVPEPPHEAEAQPMIYELQPEPEELLENVREELPKAPVPVLDELAPEETPKPINVTNSNGFEYRVFPGSSKYRVINLDTVPEKNNGIKYVFNNSDDVIVIESANLAEKVQNSVQTAMESIQAIDFKEIMESVNIESLQIEESLNSALEALEREDFRFNYKYKSDTTLSPEEKRRIEREVERAKRDMERAKAEIEREVERARREFDEVKIQEEVKRELERANLELEREMAKLKVDMARFEKEMELRDEMLKSELLKDGYISSKDEQIVIQKEKNNEIKVNGKKVKPEHHKKYKKIMDKMTDTDFDFDVDID